MWKYGEKIVVARRWRGITPLPGGEVTDSNERNAIYLKYLLAYIEVSKLET
jgi:hypothetical protein